VAVLTTRFFHVGLVDLIRDLVFSQLTEQLGAVNVGKRPL
jgi:hypothetical protein